MALFRHFLTNHNFIVIPNEVRNLTILGMPYQQEIPPIVGMTGGAFVLGDSSYRRNDGGAVRIGGGVFSGWRSHPLKTPYN